MAFRKDHLQEVGGFDPQFQVAGDDVDICWKLQSRGLKIGFNPAAVVWHHRRGSIKAFWKQQKGYGKAEALLETKWPEKYNVAGHPNWAGRVYGQADKVAQGRSRIFYGIWGAAPFQMLYRGPTKVLEWLPLVPEWYCAIAIFALLSVLGILWQPMLYFLPLLLASLGIPLVEAWRSAGSSCDSVLGLSVWARLKRRSLVAFLHVVQPLARLWGRFNHGITPWRLRGSQGLRIPIPRKFQIWSESWQSPQDWLARVETMLRQGGAAVLRCGEFDRWDLGVKGGLLAGARLRMGLEEHGSGRQFARFAVWPRTNTEGRVLPILFAGLSFGAFADGSLIVGSTLAVIAIVIATRILLEAGSATGVVLKVLEAKAEAVAAEFQAQADSQEAAAGAKKDLFPRPPTTAVASSEAERYADETEWKALRMGRLSPTRQAAARAASSGK